MRNSTRNQPAVSFSDILITSTCTHLYLVPQLSPCKRMVKRRLVFIPMLPVVCLVPLLLALASLALLYGPTAYRTQSVKHHSHHPYIKISSSLDELCYRLEPLAGS